MLVEVSYVAPRAAVTMFYEPWDDTVPRVSSNEPPYLLPAYRIRWGRGYLWVCCLVLRYSTVKVIDGNYGVDDAGGLSLCSLQVQLKSMKMNPVYQRWWWHAHHCLAAGLFGGQRTV